MNKSHLCLIKGKHSAAASGWKKRKKEMWVKSNLSEHCYEAYDGLWNALNVQWEFSSSIMLH